MRRALEGPPDGTAVPLLRIKPGHQFPYLARIFSLGTLRDRELPHAPGRRRGQAPMVPGGRDPRAERDAIRRAAWPGAPDTEGAGKREALGEPEEKAAARLRGPAFAIALAAAASAVSPWSAIAEFPFRRSTSSA